MLVIGLKLYWPLQNIHDFFISLMKDKNGTKVFCIGEAKTGTTSLHKALKILGYRSARIFDWPTYLKNGGEKYIEKIKKSNYDAFVDFPFGYEDFYKKIDVSIHGSKFILTVRDSEALEKSFFNFYKDGPWAHYMLENLPEKIKLIGERNDEIMRYFEDRKSQLLVMDITKGDGWDKLCIFLDKPIPKKPFPHKNIGRYKK